MYYVVMFLIGIIAGAVFVFLYGVEWYKKVNAQKAAFEFQARQAREAAESARTKEAEYNQLTAEAKTLHARLQGQIISHDELMTENAILKRDLQNIDVNLHKLAMDGELREKRQEDIDTRSSQLAKRYLAETVKLVVSSIGPSNFSACKQRLLDVIQRVREVGFAVTAEEEAALLGTLRHEFEKAVRAQFEREEQARIKARIREEERLKREVERELRQLERERAAIQAALDQALAGARGEFTAEVQRLQARLAEAEEKARRTISMAQQTKAGNVYVISNVGTMGVGIFKVGMTRRLEPQERIDELGSASVPFPFDVHMMIRCENAPALENAVHRALHQHRINKANPRKEFFRTTIEQISEIVRKHHGEVQYVADAEALEYRQTLEMSDEDAEFIEGVYDAADDDTETVIDDQ